MVRLKKKQNLQFFSGFVPAILSVIFLISNNWFFLVLSIISLFAIVGTIPLFRKRESLYMFIFAAVAFLPVNIRFVCFMFAESYFSGGFLIADIVWGCLFCCIFFSIEEIIFGIITRWIWRRQYKIRLDVSK